ncbi:hypothetical protein [Clostridium thermobutyricum]|uniref:hypothetical protein n=1 Tax=Clostridium thermobutyricum TaxID=29372 RepID=UPI0018AB1592|nr:hypothetical protein [Clostridium thermobutyricum]
MIKIETKKDKTELEVKGNIIVLKAEATATVDALAMMIAEHEHTNKWVVLEEMIRLIGKVEDIKLNNM